MKLLLYIVYVYNPYNYNNTMDTFPKEIIKEIIMLIEDKIYISMICKSWIRILDEIFCDLSKDKLNYNDSYQLKLYFEQSHDKNFHPITTVSNENIRNIYNTNSLNLICTTSFSTEYNYQTKVSDLACILRGYCINNHMSDIKMNRIYRILKYLFWFGYGHVVDEKLRVAFIHKSFNVILFLLSFRQIRSCWIGTIETRYNDEDKLIEQINEIINEIDFLINNNVMSYLDVYEYIFESKLNTPIKDHVLEYLSQFLHKNMEDCFYMRIKNLY